MVHRISVFKYEDKSKKWPQVFAILVASLSAICTGLFFAWSSPFLVKISSDKIHYHITEQEASYFAVIPHIVAVISCPFSSKLCDILGRKKTLLLIVIPQVTVLILKAVAKSIYMFYLARSIVGIGDGILYTALPMYIGEVSSPEVRGVWGNTMMFFNYFGQFLINVIGINFTVQQSSYICLIVPLTFVVLFSFMPESPYFQLMKGKTKEAKETLRKLRGKEDVEIDFAILQADVNRQMSESGTWKDLVCIRSNRKALEAGVFLRVSQQVSGITAFAMYTKYIFEKSGSNIDSNMSTILYSGLCSVLTLAATFTVDRIGRKVSYIISLILCTFSLAVVTVYFYIEQYFPQLDIHVFQWVPVVGMIWYITFCSFGLAVIPTLMLGELFSASIKAKGLTILFMVFAGFNFLNTYFFYLLKSQFGFYSPYLFFTVFSFISIFLSLYMIPETTGKTLEEIQQSLKGNKK